MATKPNAPISHFGKRNGFVKSVTLKDGKVVALESLTSAQCSEVIREVTRARYELNRKRGAANRAKAATRKQERIAKLQAELAKLGK